ncbi:MAG: hypothetical protein U5P41_08255 [Gammaproteobacteria bacterium]|nr:hypothetical protein [Gammaproteobacteria bacterium]
MKSICRYGFALTAAAITSASLAADFTFEVPVNINNMHPDITQMAVACSVFAPGGALATERTVFSLTDGNYTGDVTVEVTVPEAPAGSRRSAADVHEYSCFLLGMEPDNPASFMPMSLAEDSYRQYSLDETAPKNTGVRESIE